MVSHIGKALCLAVQWCCHYTANAVTTAAASSTTATTVKYCHYNHIPQQCYYCVYLCYIAVGFVAVFSDHYTAYCTLHTTMR